MKNWKRRYFVLKGTKLLYYKNEGGEVINYISLLPSDHIGPTDKVFPSIEKKDCAFMIQTSFTSRIYFLAADTPAERDAWISGLGELVMFNHATENTQRHKQVSKLFRRIQGNPVATSMPELLDCPDYAEDDRVVDCVGKR